MPTALRACRPASPNTSISSSLAPLTTWACSVKSGALATKPVTLTMRRIADRPPVTEADGGQRVQRADPGQRRRPRAAPTSAPTLPVASSSPSTIGSWPAV